MEPADLETDRLHALMSLALRRLSRPLLLMGGALLYAAVCAILFEATGRLEMAPFLYTVLGLWSVGLGGLLLADYPQTQFDAGRLTFVKCLWANVGVVATALFVPQQLRVLFLVLPLMGIIHASLHLSRRQVARLTFFTWLSYLIVHLLLYAGPGPFGPGELLLTLGFTAMLALMFVMAGQVTALRDAYQRRTERLNAALAKLSDLAMRDDLTGLYNRRYIMEVLNRQKALADRGHVGFTLCYCDLDHFKRINDHQGHQQGDRVLQAFARVAEDVVRSVDFVGRFGGEEFLLVLVDADGAAAQRVAERLAERARNLHVPGSAPDGRLTVSIGIAEFRAGEAVETVIQRADRALYAAKSAGRDRIVQG